ncbi:hypothetical protein J2T16_005826, partial [Paenibacillus intestini]|nr:hypothetical protein [Paenibacillus intestini]
AAGIAGDRRVGRGGAGRHPVWLLRIEQRGGGNRGTEALAREIAGLHGTEPGDEIAGAPPDIQWQD